MLTSGPFGSLHTPTVIGKGSRLPFLFIRLRVDSELQGQSIGSSVDNTLLVRKNIPIKLNQVPKCSNLMELIDKVMQI